MVRRVILGKGPVGATLARRLVERGDEVVLISRSGAPTGALPVDGLRHVAADASDLASLAAIAAGAETIIDAASPRYDRWPQLWPQLHGAAMGAAERTGAVLVTASNLYGHGAGSGVMTEQTPLRSTERKGAVRAQMWRDALARHESGRIRATEVRASDYVGPGSVGPAHAGRRLFAPLLAGEALHPLGDPTQPHAWTYLPDFVAALIAAAEQEDAWGRPWIAPTNAAISFTDLAALFAAEAGVPTPAVKPVPPAMVRLIGAAVPQMREVQRVAYQHAAPFLVDSSATERALGLTPTSWDVIARETTAWWSQELGARQAAVQ